MVSYVTDGLDIIQSACGQAISLASDYCDDIMELVSRINIVFTDIVIYSVSTLLFLSNSSIFGIGFCLGLAVCTDSVEGIIRDITETFKRMIQNKEFMHLAVMTTAAVIAWPITGAVLAILAGSYHGVLIKKPYFYENLRDMLLT